MDCCALSRDVLSVGVGGWGICQIGDPLSSPELGAAEGPFALEGSVAVDYRVHNPCSRRGVHEGTCRKLEWYCIFLQAGPVLAQRRGGAGNSSADLQEFHWGPRGPEGSLGSSFPKAFTWFWDIPA